MNATEKTNKIFESVKIRKNNEQFIRIKITPEITRQIIEKNNLNCDDKQSLKDEIYRLLNVVIETPKTDTTDSNIIKAYTLLKAFYNGSQPPENVLKAKINSQKWQENFKHEVFKYCVEKNLAQPNQTIDLI